MLPVSLRRFSRQLSAGRALQRQCRAFAALPQEAAESEEKIKVTVLKLCVHASWDMQAHAGLVLHATLLSTKFLWFCSQVNPYKLHRLDEGPETEVETSKSELLDMFRSMYTVSRCQPKQTTYARLTVHKWEIPHRTVRRLKSDKLSVHATDEAHGAGSGSPVQTETGTGIFAFGRWPRSGASGHGSFPRLRRLHHTVLQGSLHLYWPRWNSEPFSASQNAVHGLVPAFSSAHAKLEAVMTVFLRTFFMATCTSPSTLLAAVAL